MQSDRRSFRTLPRAIVQTVHELRVVSSLLMRANLKRLPLLFLVLASLVSLIPFLNTFAWQAGNPEGGILEHASRRDSPEFTIYTSAEVISLTIRGLGYFTNLAVFYVVFLGLSDRLIREDRTIITLPVGNGVLAIARLLAVIVPVLLARVTLVLLGLGAYLVLLSGSSSGFVVQFLFTVWAPVLVVLIHDLFLYTAVFLLGRILRNLILGVVAAYAIVFPTPINDFLYNGIFARVPGGVLDSETAVLYLFYSVMQPSQYAYTGWQAALGTDFATTQLAGVFSLWVLGAVLLLPVAVAVVRRFTRG